MKKYKFITLISVLILLSCSNENFSTTSSLILPSTTDKTTLVTTTNKTTTTTINEFKNIVFEDETFEYDGNFHSIYVKNAPSFATVVYEGNNQKEVGEYNVKATITALNYKPLILTAKMTIKKLEIIDVDNTKQQFTFDENLKYDDLLLNLKMNNFAINIEIGTEQKYSDNTTTYEVFTYENIAVADGIFYHYIDNIDESFIGDSLTIAKVIDNRAIIYVLENNKEHNYIIPSEAFYETFVARLISAPFTYLSKGEDGCFVESSLKQYYTEFGSFEIKENVFMLKTQNYIFHEEFTNSEVCKYTYFNIGNTKINIDESVFDIENIESHSYYDFCLNGVEYMYYDDSWVANIDISYFDLVYVDKGAHTILAEIFGVPITTIYLPFYLYNNNYEGYEYNVYFDENLFYQGDYSYIGKIETSFGTSRYDPINKFLEYGGKFNYYGSW